MKSSATLAVWMSVTLIAYAIGSSAPPGTSQVPQEATARPLWPPRPVDLVSCDGLARFKVKNSTFRLFDVPSDRWLVLTDVFVEYREGAKSAAPCVMEILDKKERVRICASFLRRCCGVNTFASTAPLGNPSTGLSFPPGSTVVLTTKMGPVKPCEFYYHMRGYLTD